MKEIQSFPCREEQGSEVLGKASLEAAGKWENSFSGSQGLLSNLRITSLKPYQVCLGRMLIVSFVADGLIRQEGSIASKSLHSRPPGPARTLLCNFG